MSGVKEELPIYPLFKRVNARFFQMENGARKLNSSKPSENPACSPVLHGELIWGYEGCPIWRPNLTMSTKGYESHFITVTNLDSFGYSLISRTGSLNATIYYGCMILVSQPD